jgi:hypothetical protein
MTRPALILCLALTACPKLPPVSGCEPMSHRCDSSDRPQVCSPSHRWHFVGDSPCGATAGQSCEVRNGVAGCVRASDAATDADAAEVTP